MINYDAFVLWTNKESKHFILISTHLGRYLFNYNITKDTQLRNLFDYNITKDKQLKNLFNYNITKATQLKNLFGYNITKAIQFKNSDTVK